MRVYPGRLRNDADVSRQHGALRHPHNNIVADFASRGLHGLSLSVFKFFAMAQIAGYALGGCWTHIGCAQSVVAYAFIQRDVDEHYTPVRWIREMTPVILQTMVLMGAIIYIERALLRFL